MPAPRLECKSSYGDQTLGKVRFVLHGSGSSTEAISILDEGLSFIEGNATLSTNIIHAHNWTRATGVGEPGSVVVTAIPPNYHVGYGMFTTAYIDRVLKRVSGNPLKYESGRNQLALYMEQDTEAARVHLEAQVANGYTPDQRPRLVIDPKYLVGSFYAGEVLSNLMSQLEAAVSSTQAIEYRRLEQSLQEFIRPNPAGDSSQIAAAIHSCVVGTVESLVISKLRMMRWQGLAVTGFKFYEGRQAVDVASPENRLAQQRKMEGFRKLLDTSNLFDGELSWLKAYAAHELELMRMELEAADLEAQPD